MDVELTKNAKSLLKLMWKKYKSNLGNKLKADEAKSMGDIEDLKALTRINDEDSLWDSCKELKAHDFLQILTADDTIYDSELTPKAIAYCENSFKRTIAGGIDTISKLKP